MIFRTASLLVAVASLLAIPSYSSAAFLFYQTQGGAGGFNAAVPGGLLQFGSNFDSIAAGTSGNSISAGGLTFQAINRVVVTVNATQTITQNTTRVAVNAADPAGSTTSPPNFLGAEGTDALTRDFIGSPIPLSNGQNADGNYGDRLVITVPPGARALGLNILIDTPSVTLGGVLGRLSLGNSDSPLGINTVANAETTLHNGYTSFFVGVVGTTVADILPSQLNVYFEGGSAGFRTDNVRAFAAIPEPSSLALVCLAGIAGLTRRRARRA